MTLRCNWLLIPLVFLIATAVNAQSRSVQQDEAKSGVAGDKKDKAKVAKDASAGAMPQTTGPKVHAADNPDFKVVVWYRRDDPLGTFKYEVYDVRKGEYTKPVDAWVRNIETKYPAYFVVVRGVDLKREHGDTEQLKVGSVVKRELMVAAAMSGVFLGGALPTPASGLQGARLSTPTTTLGSSNRPLGSAGIDRSYLNPPPTPFPVPVPYPRPHP